MTRRRQGFRFFRNQFQAREFQSNSFNPSFLRCQIPYVSTFNADSSFVRLKLSGKDFTISSQAMIKEKLTPSSEDDISVTCLRVSLICPIGKTRMVTPCRGNDCQHVQCFDALTYLKINEQRPRWRCPVCDRHCPEDKLIIDEFFVEIIQKATTTTEIIIQKDSSWSEQTIEQNTQIIFAPETSTSQSMADSSFMTSTIALQDIPASINTEFSEFNSPFIDLTNEETAVNFETKLPKLNVHDIDLTNQNTASNFKTNFSEKNANFIDLTVDSSDEDDVTQTESFLHKTRSKRNLFKHRSEPHPFEVQAENVQAMSDVDFDNFLIDNGLVLCGRKMYAIV